MKTEKSVNIFGLYPEQFDSLLKFLGPAKYNPTYWNSTKACTGPTNRPSIENFSVKEQLFITLLRLRRGFNVLTLAHLYDVSETTIRKIFSTWIMFLFYHFKDYEDQMFPPRDAFRDSAPSVFHKFKIFDVL